MKRIVFVGLSLCAVFMIGSAGAYFTAQAQVPENLVKAGSFAVSAEPTSGALSIDSLAPGVAVTRTLTVTNDGVLPANAVITVAKKAGITEFYEALTCRVTCQGAVLYDGSLGALRTSAIALAPAARVPVDFAIALPATAGNELAGDYAKFTVYVDAEQAR